ncbi:MAG: haloacid dehalogenase type II [Pseudomonadota bacterium]
MTVKALIFDVFGSLVDWRSSVAREIGLMAAKKGVDLNATDLAVAWRAEYQPAMERIRSGGRGYIRLEVLHRENLEIVLERAGLSEAFDGSEKDTLNTAWEKLDPWSDVVPGLTSLKQSPHLIAPCSNGSIAMMTRLARYAGFPWDAIVGAEIGQNYKPMPEVYQRSAAALGFAPDEVMMVAAHNNDLAAARDAGLKTGFFPRPTEHGPGQTIDLEAEQDWDIVARDLPELVSQL